MSTPVVFNGVTYNVPAFGDTGYAQGAGNLSSYLIAIATGTLQRSGGAFTLTNDINFGSNFGLLADYFESITVNPATAGRVRLAKTDTIDWRNNANSANLALGINGADQLTYNGTPLITTAGVTAIHSDANPDLTGSVQLISGLNVTLSQVGQSITIDSTGGGAGVTSITGTPNQIIASSPTGAVTLSLPQDIGIASNPEFATVNIDGQLNLSNQGKAQFFEASNTHLILLQAPTVVANSYSLTFPLVQGPANSVPVNDGTGQLAWAQGLVGTEPLSGGTITPDASIAKTMIVTISATTTINGPINGVDGQQVIMRILNDATHSVTLATGAGNFRFGSDIPTYTNSVSLIDYLGAIWNTADNVWDLVSVIQGF